MSFGAVASAGDPLKRGLVGWYRMLGNANDSSGRGNTGTLVASPTTTTDKFGNSNSAYSFNGTSQYIALTQTNGIPVHNADGASYSITAWVNGPSQSNTSIYGEGSSTSNNPLNYVYNSSGKLGHYMRDINGTFRVGIAATTATVFDSTWHHFAICYNGASGNRTIYVDGQLDRETTSSPSWSIGASLDRSTIAALVRTGVSFYSIVSVFDLRLYSRTLTADEVGTLFRATQRI